MTGANTYIRNPAAYTNPSGNINIVMPIRSSATPGPGPESLPSPSEPTPAPILAPTSENQNATNRPGTATAIFSPGPSNSKTEFETVLATLINDLPGSKGNGAELAERVTASISEALKKQASGFLKDNCRWRLLANLVREHQRLVLAILWGNYPPRYLATAPEKELQDRILVMNSHEQGDFEARLRRSASGPDPSVSLTLYLTSL
jgi:hypothetical protein